MSDLVGIRRRAEAWWSSNLLDRTTGESGFQRLEFLPPLDRLRQVAAAVERAAPGFVVIEGEPGVGKTRLAMELVAELAPGEALADCSNGFDPGGVGRFTRAGDEYCDLVQEPPCTRERAEFVWALRTAR